MKPRTTNEDRRGRADRPDPAWSSSLSPYLTAAPKTNAIHQHSPKCRPRWTYTLCGPSARYHPIFSFSSTGKHRRQRSDSLPESSPWGVLRNLTDPAVASVLPGGNIVSRSTALVFTRLSVRIIVLDLPGRSRGRGRRLPSALLVLRFHRVSGLRVRFRCM